MTRAPGGRATVLWRDLWPALAMLAVLVAASALRPLLPVAETRHAAVAFEMWSRGDFLVPVLNGQPDAHQPPLLFWLIHAGWAVFGVNAWWPRCIAPLFAAGTLFFTMLLGRHLWPARPDVTRCAPYVMVASLPYAWSATALMFDAMLTFFVTLGWLGLVVAWRVPRVVAGYLLLGLGLTGALYAQGPAALLHLLPPVLLAPWWMGLHRPRWVRWYAGTGVSLFASLLSMLIWAVPAAQAGGPEYGAAIFWGPATGPAPASDAQAAPWPTWVVALPALLAPWFLWPRWWLGLRTAARPGDAGLRFVALTTLVALACWWLFSAHRLHDLLPQCVLFALLVARALDVAPPPSRLASALPAATLALAGLAAMLYVPGLALRWNEQASVHAARWAGVVLLAAGAFVAWRPGATSVAQVRRIAAATTLGLAAVLAAAGQLQSETHDVAAVAARVARWQQQGRPVAAQGAPQGQWTLAGGLLQPLQRVEREDVSAWLARHPRGRAIVFFSDERELPAAARVAFRQRYHGGWLAILARAGDPPEPDDLPAASARR